MFLKAHANGRNIVGPNILRPFAWNHNNVGTCWHLRVCVLFATGQTFRPMQTEASSLAKNPQQHGLHGP